MSRIFVALLIALLFFVGLTNGLHEFKKWPSRLTARYKMISELSDGKKLHGLQRSQIIELLGEPMEENSGTLSYDMGPDSGSPTYSALVIYFGPNGTSTRTEIESGRFHESFVR